MRWAELRMCRFWAGGISSFPFSRAREYRLLRRLVVCTMYACEKMLYMINLRIKNHFYMYKCEPKNYKCRCISKLKKLGNLLLLRNVLIRN